MNTWTNDGYLHKRDENGTCKNCGASKNEYHYRLKPKETPVEPKEETTDLEYREAAMRLAIQYYAAKYDRPMPNQVIGTARFFETYLREG